MCGFGRTHGLDTAETLCLYGFEGILAYFYKWGLWWGYGNTHKPLHQQERPS